MKYYLGIDGGGTKTTAVVSDETGKILCKKEGKTINFYGVGMEKARENLLDVVKAIENELREITFSSSTTGLTVVSTVVFSVVVSNSFAFLLIADERLNIATRAIAITITNNPKRKGFF